MRYAFIHRERARHPLTALCQVLQVSRSEYYAFRNGRFTAPAHAMCAQVRRLHYASRRTYGQRRLYQVLRAEEVFVGWWRTRTLIRHAGVSVKSKRALSPPAPRTVVMGSRWPPTV